METFSTTTPLIAFINKMEIYGCMVMVGPFMISDC